MDRSLGGLSLEPIETITSSIALISSVLGFLAKLLPDSTVPFLLFGGRLKNRHKTKFAFKELVDRYKASIEDVNLAISLSIGLALIALYAYFVLPASGEVSVPFVGLKISREVWIRVVPAIGFGLQVFEFTALIWFLLLRIGLRLVLREHVSTDEDYGDITNIALRGPIGHLWIALRIRHFYESWWNYLWYLPFLSVVGVVFMAPLIVCAFFIGQLFRAGDFFLGLGYGALFLPTLGLFLLFVCTTAILGMGDRWGPLEERLAEPSANPSESPGLPPVQEVPPL